MALTLGPNWATLRSIYRSAFLCSFGFFLVSFLLPIIAIGDLGAQGIEVGLLFSFQPLGFALFSPVAGRATRVGRRREAIFFGATIRGVAYLGMALSIVFRSVDLLIATSLVWGLGAAFYLVGMDAEISESITGDRRSEAFGRRESSNSLGSLVGAVVGLNMIRFLDILWVFVFFAAMNLIGAIIVISDKQSTRQPIVPPPSSKSLRSRLGRALFALIAASALSAFVVALVTPFVEVYILHLFPGIPLQLLAIVYLPGAILSATLGGYMGRVADRSRKVVIVSLAEVVSSICILILAFVGDLVQVMLTIFPPLAALGASGIALGSIAVLFSIQSVTGLLAYTVMTSVFGTAYAGHAGEGFGIYEGALGFARFSGPLLGGLLWDLIGVSAPFILVGLAGFLIVPIYYVAMRQYTLRSATTQDI